MEEDGNKIEDLTPLVNMAEKDFKGPKRFAPFINIYLKGNPLNDASKAQLSKLKEFGCRVHF